MMSLDWQAMLKSKATGIINDDKQRELMAELCIEAGKR